MLARAWTRNGRRNAKPRTDFSARTGSENGHGADERERLDDDGRIFGVLRKPHRCRRLAAQELPESAASVISD
jgi:hypothetical protein